MLPTFIIFPFIILLLLIALLPLLLPSFWDNNRNKAIVTVVLAIPVFGFLLHSMPEELWNSIEEYVSFILLIGSLYVITGGILFTGDLVATPLVNTIFLFSGAVMASFIGTTGASMLLIRPLLKTNSERRYIKHIPIFFIFIVANIGGCLTPLGDPPLFLGYLRGVPFTWNLSLFPYWLIAVSLLLLVFYIWDNHCYQKEAKSDLKNAGREAQPIRLQGKINFLFLLGVIATVVFQVPGPWRELIMLAMIVLSLLMSDKNLRKANKFSWGPLAEVAILFAGIFITMKPLLLLLATKGSSLGVVQPWQFFWASGGLSSFLDNAPTYATFFTLAQSVTKGLHLVGAPIIAGVNNKLLTAISCGSVFMGANTYIGNGPNFMIKSIAEDQGIKMPHFFGYCLYSISILIPIFILLTFIFFRG